MASASTAEEKTSTSDGSQTLKSQFRKQHLNNEEFKYILISLQISGLVLAGLSIWTYVVHEPFLAIIPNVMYKIIVYLTFATSSFICLTGLVGLFTAKHTWKSCTSIVSFPWMY